MAKRKIPKRIIDWDEVANTHAGSEVQVHKDSGSFGVKYMKEHGSPLFSVLAKDDTGEHRYFGSVSRSSVEFPRIRIDATQLADHWNSTTGQKSRNTFLMGHPIAMPSSTELSRAHRLILRAGQAGTEDDPTSIIHTPSQPGLWTPRPRQTSKPIPGLVPVPGIRRTSPVFAERAGIGDTGSFMFNPR
jgi:hypothetical protein